MSAFSLFASAPPDAAIEIAPDAVSIAVLGSRGAESFVQAYGTAGLTSGAVVPALVGHNIVDRPAVVQALRSACENAGHRPRRAALVIPDVAARVALVRFDQVPARREDLDQLIRWQIKKSLPFPVEEACVTQSAAAKVDGGREYIVVAARREIVAEYEAVCDDIGVHAGLVDLSTLSVVNLYLSAAAPAGDWLLVHIRPEYTSLAIVRDGDLIFFRTHAEGDTDPLGDVVHQTAMFYQDRLNGQGFARVLVGGRTWLTAGLDMAVREIESRLGRSVESLDPTATVPLIDRISVPQKQGAALAPLVGMLLRSRKEVAA